MRVVRVVEKGGREIASFEMRPLIVAAGRSVSNNDVYPAYNSVFDYAASRKGDLFINAEAFVDLVRMMKNTKDEIR
jgi:hypothetical protein